jgi:hypothetical protein
MAQILGSKLDIEVDFAGGTTAFKALICLRNSAVNTEASPTQETTNCGVFTAPGLPAVTIDFDAICETTVSGTQAGYKECLAALNGQTKVKCRVQSPVVAGSSIGVAFYHSFDAYFTSLSLNQESAAFVNFSGTLQSSGPITITP